MNSTAVHTKLIHVHVILYAQKGASWSHSRKRIDGGQIVMLSCTSAFAKSGVLLGQTNFCQTAHFSIIFLPISSITNDQDGLMYVQ